MKSLLKNRDDAFQDLYVRIFSEYPQEEVVEAIRLLLRRVGRYTGPEMDESIRYAMGRLLRKTETFNVLLSLHELEQRAQLDHALQASMESPSYHIHRAIALNLCDVTSAGATSFFGLVDCLFSDFFPRHAPNGFLAKGMCALVASTAEVVLTPDKHADYTAQNLGFLQARAVPLEAITELVLALQRPYNRSLTLAECEAHVRGILKKEQTFHTIQLCTRIDVGVEEGVFGAQFQAIVGNDEGLFGVDEAINQAICKMYGMIAITNYGFLDKEKPGIIGELDSHQAARSCNTFLDDTVCAIVAAACARLAHNSEHTSSKPAE